MSSQKYRRLLVNLPSMASVVNSFQSPEVQLEVYRLLVAELEEATAALGTANGSNGKPRGKKNGDSQVELAHALVDGDSIHADDDIES